MKRNGIPVGIFIFFLIFCSYFPSQAASPFKRTTENTSELLQSALRNGEAIVWHLYHSGFAIKTVNHLLIFDYWPDQKSPKNKMGFDAGLIDANEIKEENIFVFISHEHQDHWYKGCLEWQDKIKKIQYVVSPEVSQGNKRFEARKGIITTLGPKQTIEIQDVRIKTLLSWDSGVAFLVKADGLTIYHSGDHGCWNWNNNPNMESYFATQSLKILEGEAIDIAMHVCEPRLKESGWGGIVTFSQKCNPKLLIPMHFKGNYETVEEIESVLKSSMDQTSFWAVQGPGDCIVFKPGKKGGIRSRQTD